MESILIATTKTWNIERAIKMQELSLIYNVKVIDSIDKLMYDKLIEFNPKYIFFPHWSWIIPKEIYENFTCIVFHMTDLPFGRGGSPLQNLISRGITKTKISAIKVCGELDAGDIYMKTPLILNGSAEEIYISAADIIFSKMIPYILNNNLTPQKQSGELVCFTRRTPEMSEIKPGLSINQIYDHIRMLDAEGYPRAFINFGEYKLSFSHVIKNGKSLIANVEMEIIDASIK